LVIAASGDFHMTAHRSATDKERPGDSLNDFVPHFRAPPLGVASAMRRRHLAQPVQEVRREPASRPSVEMARGGRNRLNAGLITAVA
jgi:hypothetical protein